jgi:hypothetical protein
MIEHLNSIVPGENISPASATAFAIKGRILI